MCRIIAHDPPFNYTFPNQIKLIYLRKAMRTPASALQIARTRLKEMIDDE
ncbi:MULTISPECIES: hypothetical protein [unclassified Gilliamella]|nr:MULTISPECIES: hypothetical protein [unclassified Gilliamella]MWP48292.1 hypothetical protein [Gilliamella sp. Lep-s35]MWP68212.1 hypothetical protein [Gilliamella sp. Lep-s5]MWP76432.1 hypothetical protein [Gilliamella sp. Lep-s21]